MSILLQLLLDPFEEQFHVASFAVAFCQGQGFISKMVGQEAGDGAGGGIKKRIL